MPAPSPLGRTITQLQQDLAALSTEELRAYLANLVSSFGLDIRPVLALANVAITGAPLTSKTYAREEWLDLVRAGRAFVRMSSSPAVVGATSVLQLWNPASSGVSLLVYSVLAYASAALAAGSFLTLYADDVQRANPVAVAVASGGNLLSGGGAPAALLNADAPAAPAYVRQLVQRGSGAAAFTWQDFSHHIVGSPQGFLAEVGPGHGLTVSHAVVNSTLFGSFVYAEVPSTY